MTNAEYSDLDSYEQFHSVIWVWLPLSLLTSVVVLASACCLVIDVNKMTQFPSQRTVVVWGVAALPCVTTGIRWLHIPAALGIMFVGMFLFGCIAIQSMVNLSKVFLNVTLWDMIAGVYQLLTDGSETCRYNILDVVYLPMTAMAM